MERSKGRAAPAPVVTPLPRSRPATVVLPVFRAGFGGPGRRRGGLRRPRRLRHAYFTGAVDPYAQLKRALRAEIDADARAMLNSTVSLPFPKPSTGKIAVKVINHYGDDVLKVYEV